MKMPSNIDNIIIKKLAKTFNLINHLSIIKGIIIRSPPTPIIPLNKPAERLITIKKRNIIILIKENYTTNIKNLYLCILFHL